MTYDELNKYILNYLENDKTNSAIMLTGGWGTGKSYYVKNILKPFLSDEGIECVVVSLYGIKELSEISKAIYMELRMKPFTDKTDNEAIKTGWFVAKTVAKGVSSFFGVDLSRDDESLNKLYESVNLSDKLVVFEDVERTSINIIELLGYINNLVEQDKVKVLLVCNEEELTPQVKISESKSRKSNDTAEEYWDYTDEAKEYLAYKEKTIVDTLNFEPEIETTLYSIIDYFDNDYLNKYKTGSFCENVWQIFFLSNLSLNFRTFIFATQKFLDILAYIDTKKYDDDFIEKTYYSIIAFSIQYKENREIKWDGNEHYSLDLSMNMSPLYKSCFDYIVYQECDFSNFSDYYSDYLEIYNHKDILETFYNFHLQKEEKVINTLKELEEKLEKDSISIGIYPDILLHLIKVEKYLEYDISTIVDLMTNNVKGNYEKLGGEHAFYFATEINDDNMRKRYKEIANQLLSESNNTDYLVCDFSYDLDCVDEDCKRLVNLYTYSLRNNSFATKINVEKFINLILDCTSAQIVQIRTLFKSIYEYSKPEFNIELEVKQLKEIMESLINSDKSNLDKIQKMNIEFFEKDLERYLNSLQEVK